MPTKFFDRFTIPTFAVTALIGAFLIYSSPADILDTKIYYSPEFAQNFFLYLDRVKAEQYFIIAYIDLIFLFCYTFSLELSFQRLFPENSNILFLARATGGFDLIETLGIIYALANPLDIGAASSLGIATLLKWTFLLLSLLVVGFGLVKRVRK